MPGGGRPGGRGGGFGGGGYRGYVRPVASVVRPPYSTPRPLGQAQLPPTPPPRIRPPGWNPAAAFSGRERLSQAREAFWTARGYRTVSLSNGLRVRLLSAQAAEVTRHERTLSKLTPTVSSINPFVGSQRTEGWRARAKQALALLRGNLDLSDHGGLPHQM
jgi:hypothetical protein